MQQTQEGLRVGTLVSVRSWSGDLRTVRIVALDTHKAQPCLDGILEASEDPNDQDILGEPVWAFTSQVEGLVAEL